MMDILSSSASALGLWAYALLPLLAIWLYGVYNAWLHPLRQYPGPLLWRAFRVSYVVSMHKGQLHRRLKEFHTTYGPIVRIAPDELSYADSRAWKDIYASRPGHQVFPRNRTWFKKQSPDEPLSIMGFDEAAHARYRRAFANAFSDKSLRDQAPIIEGYVNILTSRLQESSPSPVDLEHLFECVAFDIGSDLSFGESFDSLKNGKIHPWVEVAKGFGKGIALVASLNKYPPVDRLLRLIIPKKVLEKMKNHALMSSAMTQKRLAMATDRPDFVTPTKKYVDAKGGIEGKEWDINLMILVFASSETLASALTAIFRELVQHPGALQRLSTELRSTFSSEEEITIASTTHLPYLNAVVNEGLRLDPPPVITPPKVVPLGGDTVCGRFVTAGTYVAYNQFSGNRQPYNFHLPNTFLPERFLPSHRNENDNMAAFQPFGMGRHQCIGLKLAYAEMRVVVARVVWRFDLRLADERDRFDWSEQATYLTWEKRPLNVVVRRAKGLP
ncbi:cytochrome P450 [Macroventuria anomochaeta]|uniref:Cytochrome P450 n=1 Tax=Macroventuria anomochaeta TaxID=301207 RepID=A0ACB6S8B7_9PLEO|nr:cytochrome P450 [Macroventuria anomochaeta]KAF2630500.1 cytochrome P450 [Macroventuria anomochaeta]